MPGTRVARPPPETRDAEGEAGLRAQRREWRIQRVGWALMAAFIAAGLLGLLGGAGPLADARAGGGPGEPDVAWERFARVDTATTLTVTVPAAAIVDGVARVWIDAGVADRYRIEDVDPAPAWTEARADRLVLGFRADAAHGPVALRVRLTADRAGAIPLAVGLGDGPGVRFTQVVYP